MKLTKQIISRLSEEDEAYLLSESSRLGVSRSDIIRMLIRNARGAIQFPASVPPPAVELGQHGS